MTSRLLLALSFRLAISLALLPMFADPPTARAQMSAKEQLAKVKIPDDMDVSLFASEPMITNPSAIDVDTQGRVWLTEIQFYRGKAKDHPPQDKIKVLIDTDGDGVADKVVTFAEHVFCPMSICVAGDKLYCWTSPDLWVYKIKETPDGPQADGEPTKLLTGSNGKNHDHGAHSIVLGPDHKWWMSHGDPGFNITGTDGSNIKYPKGAVLRGELDGSKLELVSVNFRNPYEVCVNSFGESFLSDNDNDGNRSCRICWLMAGGDYGWFGTPGPKVPAGTPYGEHWHFRGEIPGYVPGTLVTGFGAPCGMCFYEGDAFGAKYKNSPLHADAGPAELRMYPHKQYGAGYQASSEVFMSCGDRYFRPDDICAAPDGSLYVSDWYDGGVGGHGYNDPDRGRIFRLTPKGKKLARQEKPGPYDNITDAIAGLKSPNLATQYLARERLLAEAEASIPALKTLLDDAEPNFRARALWVLDRIGGNARKLVVNQLKDNAPQWRALAVRILRRHGADYADDILPLANDESLEVVREVLLAIRNIPGVTATAAIVDIAARYDGSDRYLLEAINIAAGDAARKALVYDQIVKRGKISPQTFALLQLLNPVEAAKLLNDRLASGSDPAAVKTLLATAGTAASYEAGKGLVKLLANEKASPELRALALEKLNGNLSGSWNMLTDDQQLIAAYRKLLADPALQSQVISAVGAHNMTKLGADVLELLKNNRAPLAIRQQSLTTAVQLKPAGAAEAIRAVLAESQTDLHEAALNALVDLQDTKTVRAVLTGDTIAPAARTAVANRLMRSTGGALLLVKLVEGDKLPAELKKSIIAQAIAHPDANIRALYEQYVPASERSKKLGQAIKPDEILALKGDPLRGGKIFRESSAAQCKNCHMIEGSGGTLGPDLSLIGKKYERAAMLETIMDPSRGIAPEFVSYLVETVDGQSYLGFITEKTDKEIVLKDAQSKLIRLPAKSIESTTPQKKSIMPELVLRDVSAQDAADLLAFLQTLRQGVEAVSSFRVLGPFDAARKSLDLKCGPDNGGTLGKIDFAAHYAGVGGRQNTWDVYHSDGELGFAAFDTVKYDAAKGSPSDAVIHFAAVYVDTLSDQTATLLVGADDQVKVWVNGKEVIKQLPGGNALSWGQFHTDIPLTKGRNLIVAKVLNFQGPGGLSLGIRGTEALQLKTE